MLVVAATLPLMYRRRRPVAVLGRRHRRPDRLRAASTSSARAGSAVLVGIYSVGAHTEGRRAAADRRRLRPAIVVAAHVAGVVRRRGHRRRRHRRRSACWSPAFVLGDNLRAGAVSTSTRSPTGPSGPSASARSARPRAGRRGAEPHRPRAARHRRPLGERDGDPGVGGPRATWPTRPRTPPRLLREHRAHGPPGDGRAAPGARRAARRRRRRRQRRCRCRRSTTSRRSSTRRRACRCAWPSTGVAERVPAGVGVSRVPRRPGGAHERQPPRRAGRHDRRAGDVHGGRRRGRTSPTTAAALDGRTAPTGYGLVGMQRAGGGGRRHVHRRPAAGRRVAGQRARSRSAATGARPPGPAGVVIRVAARRRPGDGARRASG